MIAMSVLYGPLRRVDFRGKRRLRSILSAPSAGRQVVSMGEGVRLCLDLSEPLQRDYYVGAVDVLELRLVRHLLGAIGGDFIDVGAHVGLFALTAATSTRGKVLAFEPN